VYARVTLLEIDTMRMGTDAALEIYRSEVLPELREQPGYRGVIVLSTPEGRGLVLSLWESAADADASGTVGFYPDLLQRYMTMFRSPPGRERYEVSIVELPAAAGI
jgi:hypothetical protein